MTEVPESGYNLGGPGSLGRRFTIDFFPQSQTILSVFEKTKRNFWSAGPGKTWTAGYKLNGKLFNIIKKKFS